MDDLYPDAKTAVDLCTEWADKVIQTSSVFEKCRFYLFGSSIYECGEQFSSLLSDLDIICLLSDDMSAESRTTLLMDLRAHKLALELDMIPRLQRETCSEPGVSIVVVTPFEVAANIHKSGARSFFDANIFLDLKTEDLQLVLPNAGTRDVGDPSRQAIEFCQKTRNDFLGIAANNRGGLQAFNGVSPLPKALMRSAAQIAPAAKYGQWYDTRIGLEYLRQVLRHSSDHGDKVRALDKKLSIRSGGNGIREPLTAVDQLLLAELLFDEARKLGSVESANWVLRVTNEEFSDAKVADILAAIKAIAPNVKLRGAEPGSIILKLLSPVASYELVRKLHELNALETLIGKTIASVELEPTEVSASHAPSQSRLVRLIHHFRNWTPPSSSSVVKVEESFLNHLTQALLDDPLIAGAIVSRDTVVDVYEVAYTMDFLLIWPQTTDDFARIGIDVKVVRSKAAFYNKVAQVMQIGGPMILVLVAKQSMLEMLSEELGRLRSGRPNVHVVTVVNNLV